MRCIVGEYTSERPVMTVAKAFRGGKLANIVNMFSNVAGAGSRLGCKLIGLGQVPRFSFPLYYLPNLENVRLKRAIFKNSKDIISVVEKQSEDR